MARWDAKEEGNQEKDDGFWLLWGIFNEYIKQNVIMEELRKVNFYLVDVDIDENSIMKKKIKKSNSNFNFF